MMTTQIIKIPIFDVTKYSHVRVGDMEPDGYFEVEADVVNHLAIHPTLLGDTPEITHLSEVIFTLTHVPTGGSIGTEFPSRDAAEWLRDRIKGWNGWEDFSPKSALYEKVQTRIKRLRRKAYERI